MIDPQTTESNVLFEQFIDLYYPSIFSAITKLTGLTDEKELESITIGVFLELWHNRAELLSEVRPPAYIYKIVLRHVFSYLQKQGSQGSIQQLQSTLLIDPAHYAHIFEPGKKSFTLTLLKRVKKIWNK